MWPGGLKSQMRLATGERKKSISLVEQISWSQFSMLIANISNTFLKLITYDFFDVCVSTHIDDIF